MLSTDKIGGASEGLWRGNDEKFGRKRTIISLKKKFFPFFHTHYYRLFGKLRGFVINILNNLVRL